MTLLTLSNGDQDNTLCKEKSKASAGAELLPSNSGLLLLEADMS